MLFLTVVRREQDNTVCVCVVEAGISTRTEDSLAGRLVRAPEARQRHGMIPLQTSKGAWAC